MLNTSAIVEKLNLKPHPDGGFYYETFRDHSLTLSKSSLPPQYKVDRAVSTAIYFLLPSGSVACIHRIPCAETFHYYMGESITVIELNEMDGQVKLTRVGPNLLENEVPQHTVPPHVWFGSFPTNDFSLPLDGSQIEVTSLPLDGSQIEVTPRDAEKYYTLLGVTCAPAFQYEDSELAKRSVLVARFPEYEPLISLLTISD